MKIAIGCDHGALALKEEIKRLLAELGVEANDVGTYTEASVDYPDIAEKICAEVVCGRAARGIALCGTGIGISIAANKLPGIRCALCGDVYSARMARAHNDANVLALGGRVLGAGPAREIVRAWLEEPFEGGRHARRVGKLTALEQRRGGSDMNLMDTLAQADPAVCAAIGSELGRQRDKLELIASENIVSRAVMEAQGSVLTNKYAEGYPGKRYYGGCEYVDVVEQLAIDRAKKLFGAAYANVQPHSGAQANMAVFFALLSPGDTVMGMSLTDGGHLTHGSPVNMSGSYFKIVPYGVSRETETIDYDALEALALETKPKMIVAGASAYARVIDFPRLADIAKKAGAYLMTDIAHIAGLVAAGLHPSPVPYADVVTTTTHKTLRGPRGGLILSKDEAIGQKINKAIFPGIQGGPLMHVIAAKAVAFGEALRPEFAEYQRQIVKNAKALAEALAANGFRIVTGGTDNHLMLVDLRNKNITGKEAQNLLDEVGITANKNTIPFEPLSPFVTSGIRLGSPALTTRGFVEDDMREVAAVIALTLGRPGDAAARDEARARVRALCEKYPLYAGL